MGAINIKMVGVGGRNNSIVGVQLQERPVILVSLYNNILAPRVYMEVAAKVLTDSAKESTTTEA